MLALPSAGKENMKMVAMVVNSGLLKPSHRQFKMTVGRNPHQQVSGRQMIAGRNPNVEAAQHKIVVMGMPAGRKVAVMSTGLLL